MGAEVSDIHCSFCAKSQRETAYLVAGPMVFICDECVLVCGEIISDEIRKKNASVESLAEILGVEKWS